MDTAQASHQVRWYIQMLVLVLGLFLAPDTTSAGLPNVRLSGAPTFLSAQGQGWLKKMLRSRGFSICQGGPGSCRQGTIQVALSSSGAVHIRKGTTQRLFRVPSRYKEGQLKARAVVTFVTLFVEMTNPGLPAPSFRPPPLRVPARLPPRPRTRKKRRKARSPRPKPRPRPRAKTTRATPPPKQVANVSAPLTPPLRDDWSPHRVWVGVGLDGMLGLQDLSGIPLGGGLSLGGGVGKWALRLSLQFQPLLGLAAAHTGVLGRSDLLLAWAPLQQRLQLWIELGPSFELLWLEAKDKSAWQPRFGGLLGLRLAYALHPRIRVYARPALLLFPQRYEFQHQGTSVFVASVWRIELALGVEIRLW